MYRNAMFVLFAATATFIQPSVADAGHVDGMNLYRGYFVVNGIDPNGLEDVNIGTASGDRIAFCTKRCGLENATFSEFLNSPCVKDCIAEKIDGEVEFTDNGVEIHFVPQKELKDFPWSNDQKLPVMGRTLSDIDVQCTCRSLSCKKDRDPARYRAEFVITHNARILLNLERIRLKNEAWQRVGDAGWKLEEIYGHEQQHVSNLRDAIAKITDTLQENIYESEEDCKSFCSSSEEKLDTYFKNVKKKESGPHVGPNWPDGYVPIAPIGGSMPEETVLGD